MIRKLLERPVKRGKKTVKEPPSELVVWVFKMLLVFFIGLLGLEIVYMIIFQEFSTEIWSGIMTVVGAIIGLITGRRL